MGSQRCPSTDGKEGLQEENNNQTKAARRLGISRTTLWRLMKGK